MSYFCLIHSDYLYEIKNGGTRLGKGKFEGKWDWIGYGHKTMESNYSPQKLT